MRFLDREAEMARLERLSSPGLAIVWGRRRVGKTRLLLEWTAKRRGIYTVADQSAEPIQRRYFAEAIAGLVPGFAEPTYPDWRALLRALAREAARGAISQPIVIDELPYLVGSSPSLPSVLQAWVDHEAKAAGLLLVLAGSSQRMMQGLALDPASPLFGRAAEAFALRAIPAGYIGRALDLREATECVRAYSAWGGIPWYWELAKKHTGPLEETIDRLVLDPSGPLHEEPNRLLLDELPPATALRPLLDAIGGGAHRLSEIAGRIGQPATALSRPLSRLIELGAIRREQPFGESERSGKRALYRIADPFFRMWFRVVAPHRALFAVAPPRARKQTWQRAATSLASEAWEELCREAVPLLDVEPLVRLGPFGPAGRWWHGKAPEWDIVARSIEGNGLLLGEVKWHDGECDESVLLEAYQALLKKGVPPVAGADGATIVHVIFVPKLTNRVRRAARNFHVVDADDVLAALTR